jgi:hypothetical protein
MKKRVGQNNYDWQANIYALQRNGQRKRFFKVKTLIS